MSVGICFLAEFAERTGFGPGIEIYVDEAISKLTKEYTTDSRDWSLKSLEDGTKVYMNLVTHAIKSIDPCSESRGIFEFEIFGLNLLKNSDYMSKLHASREISEPNSFMQTHGSTLSIPPHAGPFFQTIAVGTPRAFDSTGAGSLEPASVFSTNGNSEDKCVPPTMINVAVDTFQIATGPSTVCVAVGTSVAPICLNIAVGSPREMVSIGFGTPRSCQSVGIEACENACMVNTATETRLLPCLLNTGADAYPVMFPSMVTSGVDAIEVDVGVTHKVCTGDESAHSPLMVSLGIGDSELGRSCREAAVSGRHVPDSRIVTNRLVHILAPLMAESQIGTVLYTSERGTQVKKPSCVQDVPLLSGRSTRPKTRLGMYGKRPAAFHGPLLLSYLNLRDMDRARVKTKHT